MPFSPTFILLQQEAFLAQGSLSAGLTALRNATYPDKASFYSGFFNTSIALERVMKLIVVTDYMLEHEFKVPSKSCLKAYGHDLVTLHASCVGAGARIGLANVRTPLANSIELELLEFFSEFAKHSRYYNLDALSSSPASYGDPLARWSKVLNAVLSTDVPKHKLETHLAQARVMHHMLKDSVHALQHGMEGNLLSLEEVFSLPGVHALAAPYMMVRVFRLISPLLKTVSELGHKAFYGSPRTAGPHVPLFSEFFVYFRGSDAYIRRKRRWP